MNHPVRIPVLIVIAITIAACSAASPRDTLSPTAAPSTTLAESPSLTLALTPPVSASPVTTPSPAKPTADAATVLAANGIGQYVVGASLAAGVSAGSPRQPYCGIRWGSLPKSHLVSTYTTATIKNLRAGRHGCFDRLILDLGPRRAGLPGGQGNGYQIRYGSAVPPIEGGVILSVVLNAAAHDEDYQPTYQPRDPDHAVDVTGFRTFRQVAFLGTFEAQTEIAIGVRARLPFRAFVLSGPGAGSRLVIDVAHRW